MVKEDDKKKTKKAAKPKEAPKPEEPKAHPKPEAKEEPKVHKAEMKAEPKPEAKEEPKKAEAPKEHHKEAKPKRKKGQKKAGKRAFVARGKRKESVARAAIIEGKGVIRINSQNLESYANPYIKEIIREPLRYLGPEANTVNISVNVTGGGMMGQAQAARTAIAHALVLYFEGMNLKDKFAEVDRSILIEDTRRVETKKFRGPKARARFQKSYR
ncbi:MAG: 30S ribosomal protein S9 [Candidatus Micrarchaeota archaeon]